MAPLSAARRLGPDGPTVSSVGFGAMALSLSSRPSEPDAIRVLHAALDMGVTLIDTADVYCQSDDETGHNERLIARALRSWGGARDAVTVATKGGYTRPGGLLKPNGRPSHLKKACEQSLRALGVEAIDLYQLHTPDKSVPFADSVGAIRDLRDQGKVRWLGLSNVGVSQIRAAEAIAPIHVIQNELSVFRRDSLRNGPVARLEHRGVRHVRRLRHLLREPFHSGVLTYCEQRGMGFLAYSPLGGTRHTLLTRNPKIEAVARDRGASAYAVAIAWLLSQSNRVVPIPSARTVEHLRDSLRAVDVEISPRERAAIAAGLPESA